jgi:DNA-directed RNA polymerase subunit M/transcription elongation factor TFIIS
MKFCPDCGRVMNRDLESDVIMFKCLCGKSVEGGPEDAKVVGEVVNIKDTGAMYKKLVDSAAHDPVNNKVMKDCPDCGLDYMTQIFVGEKKVVIWLCKCGYKSYN